MRLDGISLYHFSQMLNWLFISSERVFVDGEYHKPALFYSKLLDDIGDQLEPEVVAGVKKLIEEYKARPEPQTIDNLIEMNAETGTHLIIDMHGIGEEPNIGILSPMPEDLMMEILGTLQPDRSNVESQMDELSWGIKACHYFIIYEGDSPSEICFIGYSGD